MRQFLGFLFLSAMTVPALAAHAPKAKTPHQHHPRMTWEARFAQANIAHDGHLTLVEAKGGDTLVAKHFDEIDTTHRGYVTEDDVRIWREQRKAAHRRTKTASAGQTDKALAAAPQTVAPPSDQSTPPAGGPAKD